MKISNESVSLINQSLDRLVARFSNIEDEVVTDIHFQPIFKTGELIVFDDEEEVLDKLAIPEFQGLNSRTALKDAETILRRSLEHYRKQMDQLSILKPFSFVMVDLEKETICDLLLVDDDLLLANDELLKGLDQDLNDFLHHLLAD